MKYWFLVALWISLPAFAANELASPAHPSCSWCHTPATTSVRQIRVDGYVKTWRDTKPSFSMCISCHDGSTAQTLDEGHANHQPLPRRAGLDCLVCHDPHDRLGSYRLLRGKFGPETEKTAVLGYCRECHSDH